MKVHAQIRQLDVDDARVDEVIGEGATYEEARDAVTIPDGWQLIGWIAPEHLDRAIKR